jgi:2-dehydropantoate 2-reductase
MKISVMGAGAVGCYYGFKLARAGHDVVLIGRPQHVEAIERHGLRLETQTFDERIRVSASTEGSAVQGAQLVLFFVKSNDAESGAAAIKPHLAPDALVLSLQNGVENADRLRVRPGDELRVECEVLDVRPSKSRPKQGLIKIRTTTLNQDDEAVLVHVLNLVVLRRKAIRQE